MNSTVPATPAASPLVGWKPLVGLPLLVFAIYVSGINNGYCGWDDTYFIPDNPALRDPAGLVTIWTPNADPIRKFYPLTYTLYWLGFRIWGTHAVGYLGLNVALHAASAILVFALARRLGVSTLAAWLAAGIFAAHPMQVVSVAWLASTKNVLSAALSLAALNAFVALRHTRRWSWYAAFVALMLAALLSKSAVISVTFSVLLLDWLVLGQRSWRSVLLVLPVLAVAALLAAVTAAEEWGSPTSKTYAEPWPLRPLAAAWAVWFYFRQFFLPLDLRVLYPKWDVALSPAWIMPAIVLVIAFGALIWKRRALGGVVIWGLAHALLTLAPVIGLLEFGYLYHAPVSDHFIYLGAAGLAILVAALVDRALANRAPGKPLVSLAAAVLIISLGIMTFQRVPIYHDGIRFWSQAVIDSPQSVYARDALARRLNAAEQFDAARAHWEWLIALEPENAEFRTNYGVALAGLNRQPEALAQFERAITADANAYDARVNIANLLIQRNRPAEALAPLNDAVRAAPDRWEAFGLLAEVESRLGNAARAVEHTRRVAELRPDDPDMQLTLADACSAARQFREAIEACRTALRIAPRHANAESRLAWLLATVPDAALRDPNEALRLAHSAVSRSPQDPDYLLALAAAQAALGDFAEAQTTATGALEIALRHRHPRRAQIEKALSQIRRHQIPTDR